MSLLLVIFLVALQPFGLLLFLKLAMRNNEQNPFQPSDSASRLDAARKPLTRAGG